MKGFLLLKIVKTGYQPCQKKDTNQRKLRAWGYNAVID
jgi:hypothetical protein